MPGSCCIPGTAGHCVENDSIHPSLLALHGGQSRHGAPSRGETGPSGPMVGPVPQGRGQQLWNGEFG